MLSDSTLNLSLVGERPIAGMIGIASTIPKVGLLLQAEELDHTERLLCVSDSCFPIILYGQLLACKGSGCLCWIRLYNNHTQNFFDHYYPVRACAAGVKRLCWSLICVQK